MLVNLDLNYGTEEVHSEMVVPEGGEFEISIKESSEFAVIYNRKNTKVELNHGLR